MKILMRGYADALQSLDATRALHSRMIGQNTGNLIFTASAQRNLMTEKSTVTVRRIKTFIDKPELVNERYDHFVMPLANSFRVGFGGTLTKLTALIERLTIPVTILGVGAQASIDYDWSRLSAVEDEVKAFVRAVLDHGPSIGVRGECTAAYLNSLGFKDVVVIGCPSMFYNGADLKVGAGPEKFDASTRIAINLTKRVPTPEQWVRQHFERHPETIYIAQDGVDLEMMLGGPPLTGPADDFPGNLAHPALSGNKTRIYLNAPTWIDQMREREFAFGSRIHGNVAPILAGVPAHVVAHDSRTRELAEYFEIPFTLSHDITPDSTAEALFSRSDYGPMVANHVQRFERFTDFVESHGLDHVHSYDAAESLYDKGVREAAIGPEAVVSVRSHDPITLNERAWQSASTTQRTLVELQDTITALRKDVDRLKAQVPAKPVRDPRPGRSVLRRGAGKVRRALQR